MIFQLKNTLEPFMGHITHSPDLNQPITFTLPVDLLRVFFGNG